MILKPLRSLKRKNRQFVPEKKSMHSSNTERVEIDR